jgi:hypothetical protein
VALVRAALWIAPVRRWRLRGRTAGRVPVPTPESPPLRDIIWAVASASRFVPGASCLTRAMVAQMMLARFGRTSRLHIGVARARDGRLEAHAWLESGGEVVIGREQWQRFTPLAAPRRDGSAPHTRSDELRHTQSPRRSASG